MVQRRCGAASREPGGRTCVSAHYSAPKSRHTFKPARAVQRQRNKPPFKPKSNAAPVTPRLYCTSPSAGRSGMEACAPGLGLDKASSAAARAPDDRRVTAASCLDPHTPPNHPL